jgi:hypothetical protein
MKPVEENATESNRWKIFLISKTTELDYWYF